MMAARTYSVALTGTSGHLITIDTEITSGLPATTLTGLPDTALREARDRIRAAIINSGEQWPQRQITIGLSPASLPGRGSWSDLAIGIGILAAAGSVPRDAARGVMCLGELGLDGRLRPVHGVLPAVAAAVRQGFGTVLVAAQNAAEAALVPGVRVIAAGSLAAAADWLCGTPGLHDQVAPAAECGRAAAAGRKPAPDGAGPDLADVPGQPMARTALEICAAGGHRLSLLGPPRAGKTMLAERLPGILPPLEAGDALDVTSVHSLAGALEPGTPLLTVPPFVAPHHTASKAAITGGGSGGMLRPGAASLAHCGVLFLDEAPEFGRDCLDALRQPLETGEIVLARSGVIARFPARFTLVLAANPCPCAKAAGPEEGCSCSPPARRRYLGRISGPLLDRVDVKIELPPADRKELLNGKGFAEPSAVVAARVAAARERTRQRLAGTPWRLNAEVPGSELRRTWAPARGALATVEKALDRGTISARGVAKVIRVAWTITDLAGRDRPGEDECDTALALWLGTTA